MRDAIGSNFQEPNRVQVAIVLIVAASGGLVSLYGGAPPSIVLTATFGGLIVGIALTAYLSLIVPTTEGPPERRGR